jgi:hypothetical protein
MRRSASTLPGGHAAIVILGIRIYPPPGNRQSIGSPVGGELVRLHGVCRFRHCTACRKYRRADLRCSCNVCPDSRQVVFLYPSGQSSKAQSETYAT